MDVNASERAVAKVSTWVQAFACVRQAAPLEALRFGQEALSVAHSCDERPILVIARSNLGLTHLARGELADAVTLLERNVELDLNTERFGLATIALAVAESYLAFVFCELGGFEEAIELAATA